MTDNDKTIKVSASGYEAMREMRELFRLHGMDAIPGEHAQAAHEELSTRKSDDAYPRGAVQSIAARIGLAVMRAHLKK